MIVLRSQFSDLFLSDMLPAIDELIFMKFKDKPDPIPMIFNMKSSDRSIEQSTGIVAFGAAAEIQEGSSVSFEDMVQGYDKTYTHLKYGLGFKVSDESVDDGNFDFIAKASKALAKSAFETRQVNGSNHFNRAFNSSYTGGDAKELCATDHPLVGGGTEQNELTTAADLAVASLRTALNDLEDTTDDNGLLLNIRPEIMLIPNELEFDAEELLKSSLRPDTSENAVNAFLSIGKVKPIVWNYLTDADAWFLLSSKDEHDMRWYDRKPMQVVHDRDFDSDANKVKIVMRFSSGWNDFRGVFGTPGA